MNHEDIGHTVTIPTTTYNKLKSDSENYKKLWVEKQLAKEKTPERRNVDGESVTPSIAITLSRAESPKVEPQTIAIILTQAPKPSIKETTRLDNLFRELVEIDGLSKLYGVTELVTDQVVCGVLNVTQEELVNLRNSKTYEKDIKHYDLMAEYLVKPEVKSWRMLELLRKVEPVWYKIVR